MSGAILPLPQYAFIAWCSAERKHRDNSTFTFTVIYANYSSYELTSNAAMFSSKFKCTEN
jgi:hypothetical protein